MPQADVVCRVCEDNLYIVLTHGISCSLGGIIDRSIATGADDKTVLRKWLVVWLRLCYRTFSDCRDPDTSGTPVFRARSAASPGIVELAKRSNTLHFILTIDVDRLKQPFPRCVGSLNHCIPRDKFVSENCREKTSEQETPAEAMSTNTHLQIPTLRWGVSMAI